MSDNPASGSHVVPFHGNCPSCHHFHTNTPLSIPKNPSTHTRLHCEYCDYPILGIGRASTQTTLASVETLATNEGTQQCNDRAREATLPVLRIDSAPMQEQERNEPLSAITEASSSLSRSQSALGSLSGEVQEGRSQVTGTSEILDQQNPHPVQAQNLNRTSRGNRLDAISGQHEKQPTWWITRLKNKARGITPSGLKHFLRAKHKTHEVDWTATPSNSGPARRIRSEQVVPNPNSQSVADTPQGMTSLTLAHSSHGSNSQVGSPDQQGRLEDDDWHLYTSKAEKIKAKRRERTVRKHDRVKIICQCTSDCKCQQRPSRSSNETGHRNNSLSNSEVPSHPLHRLLAEQPSESERDTSPGNLDLREGVLMGIGDHLAVDGRSSREDVITDHILRGNSRLSTATTVLASNASSASLTTGGLHERRSSSTHGTSAGRFDR